MARLVIVSNRVALPREGEGRAGGLAVALREALQQRGGLWFGWSGEVAEQPSALPQQTSRGKVTYATVDLSPADFRAYYVGFANSVLWPLFHYRLDRMEYERAHADGYARVNRAFADALAPLLCPDDTIWIHDYHLIPLAEELRRRGVRAPIGFFLHIPFPQVDVATMLPRHAALLRGFMAYDLVGLQTARDAAGLTAYLTEELGGLAAGGGAVTLDGRSTRVAAFPIGIDARAFAAGANEAALTPEAERVGLSLAGSRLILGVDRLDYSKGLPQKIEAFGTLLREWPVHRRRATFMQIAPISRGEARQYRDLRAQIERLAGHVNGTYAEFDWAPIRYLNRSVPRSTLAGLYRLARVGYVTPLRDGMNLVAKEFVAAQNPLDPGVLVLSRFAGAAQELKEALIVNPHDPDQMAAALHTALTMPQEERIRRWMELAQPVRANTIVTWRERFLAELADAHAHRVRAGLAQMPATPVAQAG